MAEGSNPDEGSPWWNSWLQTAKEKSTAAYEFFKRDLSEFSSTVQQDTVTAVSSTAAFVRDKLRLDDDESVTTKAKEGISTLIGTISEAFSPTWDAADDELSIIKNSEVIPVDRWQASLHSILVDRNTYCHEPDCPPEVYESWLETFNLEDHKEEVAEILLGYDEVQQLYNDLVPSAVSHEEFWERYFFRVFQLREAEEELVNSVQQSSARLSVGGAADPDQDANTPRSKSGQSRGLFRQGCAKGPIAVPPNTPNAPSAEQSTSNSPTSKSAPVTLAPSRECSGDASPPLVERNVGKADAEEAPDAKRDKGDAKTAKEEPQESAASSESNGKDLSDWEKDFELELTEEAKEAAKAAAIEGEDDWENWE